MSAPNRVFIGRLDNLVVLGPDGESVGRVRDVVLTMQIPTAPRAVGLVIQLLNRRRIFVPMLRIASIEPGAITLITGNLTVRSFKQQPLEMQVLGEMIDSIVAVTDPDIDELSNVDCVVTDVEIEQTRSRDWVVSRVAVRRRTGPFSRRGAVHIVDWEFVSGISPTSSMTQREQDAATLAHRYGDMRPADAASAIRNLPQKRRMELARVLDDERLADIVQELPDDDQTELLSNLPLPRAADVLEAMDPDDAADLLGELPDHEAEALLNLMNKQDAGTVRRLLRFSPNTAGGIMTPEPVILPAHTTVAEALAHVRNPELSAALASLVFVVRPPTSTPTGKYLGCVHTQRLLREPPSTLIGDYVDNNLSTLTPSASIESVARFLATYNLVCAPVMDGGGHLIGAVSVDDLLDHLLPEDWREKELMGSRMGVDNDG